MGAMGLGHPLACPFFFVRAKTVFGARFGAFLVVGYYLDMDFLMFLPYEDFLMFISHRHCQIFLLYSNFSMFISLGIPYTVYTVENPKEKTGLRAPGPYIQTPMGSAHVARETPVPCVERPRNRRTVHMEKVK